MFYPFVLCCSVTSDSQPRYTSPLPRQRRVPRQADFQPAGQACRSFSAILDVVTRCFCFSAASICNDARRAHARFRPAVRAAHSHRPSRIAQVTVVNVKADRFDCVEQDTRGATQLLVLLAGGTINNVALLSITTLESIELASRGTPASSPTSWQTGTVSCSCGLACMQCKKLRSLEEKAIH